MVMVLFTVLISTSALMIAAFGQQQDVTYKIWEEQELGTFVGNVARDSLISSQYNQVDFQKLQYSIPPTLSKFTIDSKTSTIRTAQVLDREKICDRFHDSDTCILAFDVSVYRVSNDDIFNLLKIIKVKVLIEDINDNPPVFPSNHTTLDISENLEVGQALRTSGAIDADTGINNTVQRYSLEGGLDVFGLKVMPNAGGQSSDLGIVLKKTLDREKKAFYQLKVIAEDGGFPKLSGSVDIFIRVIDVNDNTPQFVKSSFDAIVPEDKQIGSILLSLKAEDADEGENGRLSYSFSSLTSSKVTECLAIGDTTGEIYLVKHLDYEKDKLFRFAVTVADNGSPARSAQTSVQIWVQDVNDNAPQIDVTLPSPYVKESVGVGNYIAHVSLSDIDSSENSRIACNIANDHFMLQKFSDSDSIYTVILRSHLDYEKSHTEVINITCQDGGHPPLYNSSVFTVYVQDINDNAPVFTRTRYQVTIDEDNHIGQFVAQVQAIDPDEGDNGNVTYSFGRNPDNKFHINPVSGVIKALEVLDHEERASYELEVIARDKGSVPNSSSVTVTILVGDLNDNPPQFIRPYFEMSIQENKPIHASCGNAIALDPDTNEVNHLRFQFTSNVTFSDTFAIDPLSGCIFTLSSLDRELKNSYNLEVMVYDESEPRFYDIAIVTITVTDDNDNKPKIVFPTEYNNTFQFLITQSPGRVLLTVESEDADVGENGTVRFSIVRGNDKGLFFINSVSGEMVVARRMNLNDVGSYTLVVLARDGGQTFLESVRDINIIILIANGTVSYLQEEEGRANIAIVIALICITTVLAIAVLVTICIIRRIDRERKQHSHVKAEEENIYKQQVATNTPLASPARGSYENEIEKLKRKIRRDMSFVEDDDIVCSDQNKSSFSTFRTATSDSDQKNLSHSLSPSDMSLKRFHYVDKGIEIGRLTSSPSRGEATSSAYQSGRSKQWSTGQLQSAPGTAMKYAVEDATSHSSGSTCDSGRGGSCEDGEGHGHTHAVTVAVTGDGDRARTPAKLYTSPGHLITFGSPRSNTSSSNTSHQPRSLSTSASSETAKKRLWGDSSTNSTSGTTLSHRLSSDSPLEVLGLSEISVYKPNISFSDDSVTANTMVGNIAHSVIDDGKRVSGTSRKDEVDNSRGQLVYVSAGERFADGKSLSPTSVSNLTSTQRQKLSPSSSLSDTPLAVNISRIPVVDSSTRHGMFVESVILSESTGPSRSRSYPNRHRAMEIGSSHTNDLSNNGTYQNKMAVFGNSRSAGLSKTNPHSSLRTGASDTQTTLFGEEYSLHDVRDVLDQTSTVGTQRDDDNTTTTSGSYTINADDLREEIDQLFFNDVVV